MSDIAAAFISVSIGFVIVGISHLWFEWRYSSKKIYEEVARKMDADYGDDPVYSRWKAEGGLNRCFNRYDPRVERARANLNVQRDGFALLSAFEEAQQRGCLLSEVLKERGLK